MYIKCNIRYDDICLKNFKMAAMVVILDIGSNNFRNSKSPCYDIYNFITSGPERIKQFVNLHNV